MVEKDISVYHCVYILPALPTAEIQVELHSPPNHYFHRVHLATSILQQLLRLQACMGGAQSGLQVVRFIMMPRQGLGMGQRPPSSTDGAAFVQKSLARLATWSLRLCSSARLIAKY